MRIHFPCDAFHSSWKCLLLATNEIKGEGEQRQRGVSLPADGAYHSTPFMTLGTHKPIKCALAPSPLLLEQNQKQEAVQRRNRMLFYSEVALLTVWTRFFLTELSFPVPAALPYFPFSSFPLLICWWGFWRAGRGSWERHLIPGREERNTQDDFGPHSQVEHEHEQQVECEPCWSRRSLGTGSGSTSCKCFCPCSLLSRQLLQSVCTTFLAHCPVVSGLWCCGGCGCFWKSYCHLDYPGSQAHEDGDKLLPGESGLLWCLHGCFQYSHQLHLCAAQRVVLWRGLLPLPQLLPNHSCLRQHLLHDSNRCGQVRKDKS